MSDENPTWETDIKDFFTQMEIGCMRNVSGFTPPMDLGDYESVKQHSARIFDAVDKGRMPRGDRPWPREKVATFDRWMKAGFPR
jgi:hypothetical protein